MGSSEADWIGIEAYECLTALGDSAQSCAALLKGTIGLKAIPVLGKNGGELVPLATRGDSYDETIPPRWVNDLDGLVAKITGEPWGDARHPVFVTSSNYDVGSLYEYRDTGDEDYLRMGTPANSLEYLKERYGWGPHCLALSHACVTAHVGIEMATRYLNKGLAEKALILSFDYISPFVAGGFHSLKILNEQFPAPYGDREIGSIGLGDGAGFVVLSKAKTDCRIVSNFLYNEMYHFTANNPDGSGFKAGATWLKALLGGRKAWIKGHGTGTLEAGRLESEVFAYAFPESPLVSWKGSLGHTLGSCGLVEMAIVLKSIEGGFAPGTVGATRPVMAENVCVEMLDTKSYADVALFSNAFGGAHAGCLIRYD